MENPKPIVENSSEFPDVSIIEKTPDHSSRDCENKNGDTDDIIFETPERFGHCFFIPESPEVVSYTNISVPQISGNIENILGKCICNTTSQNVFCVPRNLKIANFWHRKKPSIKNHRYKFIPETFWGNCLGNNFLGTGTDPLLYI